MDQTARIHSNLFIGAGLLLAVSGLVFRFELSSGAAIVALGAVVAALGLPHGALDLFIARDVRLWSGWKSFVSFHAAYLLIAALTVLAFELVPALALALFLLASIWHFSDDWPSLSRPMRLGATSVIVLGPVLADPQGVGQIFYAVIGHDGAPPGETPYPFMLISSWVLVACIAGALIQHRRSGIELAMLAVLALVLPALIFFAVYFTLLHSPRHMVAHRHLVAGGKARLTALLYTALASAIVVLLILFLPAHAEIFSHEIIRGLFVGLAALTFPHMLLLEYRSRQGIGAR